MPETTVYELAILYRADPEGASDEAAAKVKALVADRGGKIIAEDAWGKRQLAYRIKRETHAVYVFYDIEIGAAALPGIEAALNINEEVLRYQFHRPDPKAREATAARAAARASAAAGAEEGKEPEKAQEAPAS